MPIVHHILAFVILAGGVLIACESSCDCEYQHGGCVIVKAPTKDHKCRCTYRGFWSCFGTDVPCSEREWCPPPNCLEQKCCCVGGGDCGGYSLSNKNCVLGS